MCSYSPQSRVRGSVDRPQLGVGALEELQILAGDEGSVITTLPVHHHTEIHMQIIILLTKYIYRHNKTLGKYIKYLSSLVEVRYPHLTSSYIGSLQICFFIDT